MDLKELKKLAIALDDNGKQELIYFLQSLRKTWQLQIVRLMKSRSKSIKMGLFVRIATIIRLCDLENTVLKHVLERSNGNVTAVNPAVKHSTTSPTPLFNAPEDLIFGFDSSNV